MSAGLQQSAVCLRPGCGGAADEDGYCDSCGFWTGSAPAPRPEPGQQTVGSGASPTTSAAVLPLFQGARGNLGAGLVAVEPVAPVDASAVVLTDPHVPAARRRCSGCHGPVGVEREGHRPLTTGYCTACRRPFSFDPKLQKDELVSGQYLVAGCLTHGGMGWIYLARDRKLDDRWVVLKGLFDTSDESAMAAAIAERRFLSQVSHANIVEVYNFVEHGGLGYIVMEYVGGSSLRDLRMRHREETGRPLPVAVALAYGLEVLTALGFLHSRGLLYCDLKPDNVIQSGELIKLIDLGGVRRVDDDTSDIYGTVGYQAPEIRTHGPSVASDIFTVGRLMAVLAVDFAGYQDERRYATSLPTDAAVFRQYPSFHRLLMRATDRDPGRRFQSAAEMADQVYGVLRQVVAVEGGDWVPAPSRYFGGERVPDADAPSWRTLPLPWPDPDDEAAGILANLPAAAPDQVLEALRSAPPTREVRLRRVRAALEADDADSAVAELRATEGRGWRQSWWSAMVALARSDTDTARDGLQAVLDWCPGELAPYLGLGIRAELVATAADRAGPPGVAVEAWQEAAAHYDLVSVTDRALSGAAFGAARAHQRLGNRAGATTALDRVPATSVAYATALVRLCRLLCADVGGTAPSPVDLTRAATVLAALDGMEVSPSTQLRLRSHLLAAGVAIAAAAGGGSAGPDELAGIPWDEPSLRAELEGTMRALAGLEPPGDARTALVDLANSWRPWSWR